MEYVIFGSAFACKRYDRYKGFVSWEEHSVYKRFRIERAYELKTSGTSTIKQPKALYRAAYNGTDGKDGYIVGDGLAQVKDAITLFIGGKEPRAKVRA